MQKKEQLEAIEGLLEILDELREKCPWDRAQTMESLRTLTIEETYELADAILEDNMDELKKELGDLLLHILFYSKIGAEKGLFDIGDVARAISEKLVYRHPHVFGDTSVADAEEVMENWEQLKINEGKKKRVLSGVPNSLPAMIKAYRIQEKVKGIGFDWKNKEEIWEKVQEEIAEVSLEMQNGSKDKFEEEIGDLFFSLINAARLYDVNPENALERSNRKFIRRFVYLEEKTLAQGKNVKDLDLEEMDSLWEEAKTKNL